MSRAATPGDCAAIAEIWNPIIRDTLVTFTTAEKTATELEAVLRSKAAEGLPFLVAERAGEIAGFATYGQFRAGPGYARTMEHTIMLAPAAQGHGLGRGLIAGLVDHGRARGVHSLWAGVSAENPGGVRFHAAMGFAEIGRLPQVGYKFGRWLDLVLMQKILV
ncbi:N-acetyltransferase family protein [Thioclava sp. BHET1]|nr:N-acetyltransferase family protein [Thioclava sp. BHET1]